MDKEMNSNHKIRIAIPEIGQNMRNYVGAVRGIGAEPVVISVSELQVNDSTHQEYLDVRDFKPENYDGLLLPGGVDIEPKRYGEENTGCLGTFPALDELQFDVLDRCVKAGLPVMGICRGYQVINVYFGGSMIQDLPTAARHARYSIEEPDKVHVSHANHGSWLSRIYGTTFSHNSAHHQGIGNLGKGLVIDSRCVEDGVIEAIHHESLPIIGLQWHPERMCFENARKDTVDGSVVFHYFLGMCVKEKKREEIAEESHII